VADISDELITYLKTVSGVTAIIGTSTAARIYNQDGPPQGVLNPTQAGNTRGAVCIVKQEDMNTGYMGGRSALNKATFAITSYAVTPTDRNTLNNAVWAGLAPEIVQTMGSTAISEIVTINKGSDGDDYTAPGSDQRLYVAQAAYSIWYYT
jgi:hypothetical protein